VYKRQDHFYELGRMEIRGMLKK